MMKIKAKYLVLAVALLSVIFIGGCIKQTGELKEKTPADIGQQEVTTATRSLTTVQPISNISPKVPKLTEPESQHILEIRKEIEAIRGAISLRLNDLESRLPQEPTITKVLVISKSCSSSNCYTSLQQAVDHASEGTLIKFEQGEYIFDAATEIRKNNLTIDCQGATLKDTGFTHVDGMLRFKEVNNNVVKNCNIIQTHEGKSIYFIKSSHNIVRNNTIRGVVGTIVLAILMENSSHNLLESNTIDNTHDAISLWENSSYNLARNNRGSRNEKLVLIHLSENNIALNNTAVNNTNDGIYLATSHNNIVVNNTLYKNDHNGMHIKHVNWRPDFGGSHNNIVFNNRIISNKGIELGSGNLNGAGLDIQYSDNNTVANNLIEGNFNGLFLVHNSTSNRIINNTIINNRGTGLEFSEAKNNYVLGNTACNNTGPDLHGGDPLRSISNSGEWNTCGKMEKWNDVNASGCAFVC